MKTIKKIGILLFLLPLLFISCIYDIYVVGNNDYIDESRTIPEFKQISASGNYAVYFEYANEPEVTITCESNLLPYIETAVFDNQLRIGTPSSVNMQAHRTIEVWVKGPYVNLISLSGLGSILTDTIIGESFEVKVSGSGNINTAFIGKTFDSEISGSGKMNVFTNCETAQFNISGSGKIEAEGDAHNSIYNISGSGTIKSYDFWVDKANINISGSGNGYVTAFDYLEVKISGSGDIYYRGTPVIKQSLSGSGQIINSN